MEEALVALVTGDAAVTAIVGTRFRPLERRQGETLPALTYTRITGRRDHAHDGPTGLFESRVQIDAWAEDTEAESGYSLAKRAIRAVVAALGGYSGQVGATPIRGIFVGDERDLREEGAAGAQRLARVSLDLVIWHIE